MRPPYRYSLAGALLLFVAAVIFSGNGLSALQQVGSRYLVGATGVLAVFVNNPAVPTPDTTAPVVTLIGHATVQLTVGDVYIEQGATSTDNVDSNLPIQIFVDGSASSTSVGNTFIDTSVPGTHSVLYRATDSAGNPGSATRSVVVTAAANNGGAGGATSSGGAVSSGGGGGGFYYNPNGTVTGTGAGSTTGTGGSTSVGTPGNTGSNANPGSGTGTTGAPAGSSKPVVSANGTCTNQNFTSLLNIYAQLPSLKTLPPCTDLNGDHKLTLADFSVVSFVPPPATLVPAQPAHLSVYPASIALKKGDAVGFYIRIQSQNPINTVGATIVLPQSLAFLSASEGTVFTNWIEHPSFDAAHNEVLFAGTTHGGWTGDGVLMTVQVAAKEAGTYSLSYDQSQTVVYINDGKGTEDTVVYAAVPTTFARRVAEWAAGVVTAFALLLYGFKRRFKIIFVSGAAAATIPIPPRDSAGGIVVMDGKMVLVNQGSNVWSFPKGGIEKDETKLDAAKREVSEETGLTDLTLVTELGSYKRRTIGKGGVGEVMDRPESTRTLFLFTTSQKELTPQAGEIVAVRWATIDEALELLTHPKDKAFLASMREKIENALK